MPRHLTMALTIYEKNDIIMKKVVGDCVVLGKIYYENDWHIMRFKDGNLEILFEKCVEPPLILKGKEQILADSRMLYAILEDYQLYIFDIQSGKSVDGNRSFALAINNINYFTQSFSAYSDFVKIEKISSVSFVNGVVKPMTELSDLLPFMVELNGQKVMIEFGVNEAKNNLLFDINKNVKMLTSNCDIIHEYNIKLTFQESVSIDFLNKVITDINKFIGFYNFDLSPYIQKTIIESNDREFIYFNNVVNYTEKYIKKWNYIKNCPPAALKKMIEEFANNSKYNIEFIKLTNTSEIGENDIWCLARSIEAIGEKYDLNLEDDISLEIKKHRELKDKINQTINDFENESNYKLDSDKKSFILSLIEISKFRQKVESILKKYNDFSSQYAKKYPILSDQEIQDCSKKIQKLRNTIHGNTITIDEESKKIIYLVVFALYLHILKDFGADNGSAFNLIQMIFSTF